MVSEFPLDVLSEIFENLWDENVTLFNCLLVNHSWCEVVVPILWRNPLKDLYKKNRNELSIMMQHGYNQILHTKKNLSYLLRTLLQCLSSESKDLLFKNGYELSDEVFRQPRFDYASYCRYISTADVSVLILSAMNQRFTNGFSHSYKIFLVTQEVYKLFLEKSTRIFQLSLMSEEHSLYYYLHGARSSLASLTILRYSSYVSPMTLYGLAQFCHNIKDITIEFCTGDHDGVNSLVRVQKELKYFQCKLISSGEEQCCRSLGIALKTQAHSLLKLDLGRRSCIPLKFIPDFTNLRYLRFGLKSEVSEIIIGHFKRARISNLETLIVDGNAVRSEILEPLILNTNGNLRKLHVSGWCPNGPNDPGLPLTILGKRCPKLKFLTIWMDDDLEGLETLLNKCRELEGLYLRCTDMHSDEHALFNILKRTEMPRLSKLKLEDRWLVEKGDAFEEFLKVRKRKNAKPISLEVVGYLNSDVYLDMLSLYRWCGVLNDTKVLVYGEESAADETVPLWKVAARI
ncbi:13871_t:CDS:1 [Acaulospora colombiana]|uniref:13871_t:CDS:1 n=1 Tax=Acaulospora colombiana TaxID=27376 RepID=A0ACA9KW22_9GLOM|nr:13871_t:CDS:1 [Acaulospora colombiana]